MVKRTIELCVKEEDYENFCLEQGATEEEIELAKEEDTLEELVGDYLNDFSPNDYSPYVDGTDETW
jgi:hypothetical protein